LGDALLRKIEKRPQTAAARAVSPDGLGPPQAPADKLGVRSIDERQSRNFPAEAGDACAKFPWPNCSLRLLTAAFLFAGATGKIFEAGSRADERSEIFATDARIFARVQARLLQVLSATCRWYRA